MSFGHNWLLASRILRSLCGALLFGGPMHLASAVVSTSSGVGAVPNSSYSSSSSIGSGSGGNARSPVGQQQVPQVVAMSFSEWKAYQIAEARSKVNVASAPEEKRLAQQNYDFMSGLSFKEFAAIYLKSLQNNPEALRQVAYKLTPEEVASALALVSQTSTSPNSSSNPSN